jgi:hypothetical protein
MLKDSTIITAIGNPEEEKKTAYVKYEDIIATLGR